MPLVTAAHFCLLQRAQMCQTSAFAALSIPSCLGSTSAPQRGEPLRSTARTRARPHTTTTPLCCQHAGGAASGMHTGKPSSNQSAATAAAAGGSRCGCAHVLQAAAARSARAAAGQAAPVRPVLPHCVHQSARCLAAAAAHPTSSRRRGNTCLGSAGPFASSGCPSHKLAAVLHRCTAAPHNPLHTPRVACLRVSAAAVAIAAAAAVPDVFKEGPDPQITAFQQHQKNAPRPTPAEDARTLMTLAQ